MLGANIRKLRKNLQANLDRITQQLAWDVIEHARSISEISKGTLISGWGISFGPPQSYEPETEFKPYSWYEGNELSQKFPDRVRQTFQKAMQAKFSIPVYISNQTPYLIRDVNTNPHLGGTRVDALDGYEFSRELAQFARLRLKALIASTNFSEAPIGLQI